MNYVAATLCILVGMLFAFAAYSIRPPSSAALCLVTGLAWVYLGGTWLT